MTESLIYILLPVVLFLINLVIIVVDRRKRRLKPVMKAISDAKNDFDSKAKSFRNQINEVEQTFNFREKQIRELLDTLSAQESELNGYSEDLTKLKTAITGYEKSLQALAKLTEDADSEIEIIKTNTAEMSSIRNEIKTIKEEFTKFVEEVDQLKQKTLESLETTRARVNDDNLSTIRALEEKSEQTFRNFSDSTAECINDQVIKIDDAMRISEEKTSNMLAQVEAKIETAKEIAKTLDESGLHLLSDIGDRAFDQLRIHADIDALTAQKEKLQVQIDAMGKVLTEGKSEQNKEVFEEPKAEEEVFEDEAIEEEEENGIEYTGEDEEIIFD